MGGKLIKKKSKEEKPKQKIHAFWLDKNVNNKENSFYQELIIKMEKFELKTYVITKKLISELKKINFEKTYIIISGSISQEFFIEFEKVIGEIKINPIIIIFTSKKNFNLIKKNIISLNRFSLFDMNLVFEGFKSVQKIITSENKYKPNIKESNIKSIEMDDCFSFEYIKELRDLILPLTFSEFLEIPSKSDIIEFNHFLLDKYYLKDRMKFLIEQLLVDIKIPFQILVKYWIRAYTLETPFYIDMNYSLERKLGNDYDIFIRVLYHGLLTKSITPLINQKLYRGAIIKIKEIEYIKNSLKNKKEELPGCICYNKAFLSSSLDKEVALKFMKKKKIAENEAHVLYIFEKGNELDKEYSANADVQNFSKYNNEKEILFFPFSCFKIKEIKNKKIQEMEYFAVYLNYIGEYKTKIDKSEKIPENDFAKDILQSQILEKTEMNKESNKNKFDFNIEKYITEDLKKSFILAIYDIGEEDINKKMQILNCDNINREEIKQKCNIYLNNNKIDFTFEYTFNNPGKYTFKFEFSDLLTNANKLFYECKSLISLNVEKFKSNYIKDMSDMFNGCSKLESLDLSNFKTREVLSMKSMIKKCNSLKNVDLSSFDTKNVTDMSEMFCDCISLSFLNLSNFNTEKVTTMYRMFYNCKSLYFVNLSSFQSNNITTISEMFYDCSSMNSLDLSNFEINNNINTDKLFYNCSYFKSLKNEFLSEIANDNMDRSIEVICREFLSNEQKIHSHYIQSFFKKNKINDIQILNQAIKDYLSQINHINILLLGEEKVGKTTLINSLYNIISENNELFSILEIEGINNTNMDLIYENILNEIKESKPDKKIHFIWFCFNGIKLSVGSQYILSKLINKFLKDIPIFIIYLKNKEKDEYNKFIENFNNMYSNISLDIIPVLPKNNNIEEKIEFDVKDIITKIKNSFIELLYKEIHVNTDNVMDIVKMKIEEIKPDNNLDLPDSVANHFEKLLGKRDDIIKYLRGISKSSSQYSKRVTDIDTISSLIDKFKAEKLKLKVVKTKNLDIESIDEELNKELISFYSKISQAFYEQKYGEIISKFFKDFIKREAEKIILQTLKDLTIENLKPSIENILNLKI